MVIMDRRNDRWYGINDEYKLSLSDGQVDQYMLIIETHWTFIILKKVPKNDATEAAVKPKEIFLIVVS